MLKYETMRKLIACPDRDSLIHEVHQLTEEEAKVALIMAMLSWRHGNEINDELMGNLMRRIDELEKLLADQSGK